MGSWKVTAKPVQAGGRFYVPQVKKSKVKVRGGKTTNLKVVYKAANTARNLSVSNVATNSISVRFVKPKKLTPVAIRYAAGTRPPASVKSGVGVAVGKTATSATLTGLTPGGTYSVALFTKIGKKWVGPLTLTASTTASLTNPTYPGAPPTQAGAAYAGGIYVGTTQDENGKQYALVASPRSMQFAPSALSPYLYWDRDNYNSSTGTYRAAPKKSEWDGLANTQSGAAVDGGYMIFNHVINMTAPNDGGSAWYVPAKNELNLLWQSLGEAGLAFDYVKDGSTYVVWWLWSSTERTSGADAWYQIVRGTYGGNQNGGLKDSSNNYYGVRPVRRVAL